MSFLFYNSVAQLRFTLSAEKFLMDSVLFFLLFAKLKD